MKNQGTFYSRYIMEMDKLTVLMNALSGFELGYNDPTDAMTKDLEFARRHLEKFAEQIIPDLKELYATSLDYPLETDA